MIKKIEDRGATRVILFGSLAQDRVSPWSDADLLVIIPDNEDSKKWRQWIYEDTELRIAVDVLVFTVSELRDNLQASGFLRAIVENGVVLYERT